MTGYKLYYEKETTFLVAQNSDSVSLPLATSSLWSFCNLLQILNYSKIDKGLDWKIYKLDKPLSKKKAQNCYPTIFYATAT